MGHLLGYARVSTTDQQPQLQVDALQRAGCYREHGAIGLVDRSTLGLAQAPERLHAIDEPAACASARSHAFPHVNPAQDANGIEETL
jgi:hypothetical protein